MEMRVPARLAYVVKGEVKDKPYFEENHLENDLKKIVNSSKPMAWFVFNILDCDGTEVMAAHRFNSVAIWRRVGSQGLPEIVAESLQKAHENPNFMGVRLDYWPEAEVYHLQYYWLEEDLGLKTYQHVLLGKNGGAVRWYEDD